MVCSICNKEDIENKKFNLCSPCYQRVRKKAISFGVSIKELAPINGLTPTSYKIDRIKRNLTKKYGPNFYIRDGVSYHYNALEEKTYNNYINSWDLLKK